MARRAYVFDFVFLKSTKSASNKTPINKFSMLRLSHTKSVLCRLYRRMENSAMIIFASMVSVARKLRPDFMTFNSLNSSTTIPAISIVYWVITNITETVNKSPRPFVAG